MQTLRIKEIVKSKGMTIGDLAERLGVSRQALNRQMQGKLLVETAERIAAALEVPVWQLFVSEKEILGRHNLVDVNEKPKFCAFIKNGNKCYYASTPEEAREIINGLEV